MILYWPLGIKGGFDNDFPKCIACTVQRTLYMLDWSREHTLYQVQVV